MANISDEEKSAMAAGKGVSVSEGETPSVYTGQVTNFDKSLERKLVRKLDFVLLPWLSLMYFFNSVDRSNLGNAKTDGMDTDLNFSGNEYSLLILLFYVPFGLMDLPLALLTKRFSARTVLPTLMVGWGGMALVQCAAKSFAHLLPIRLILAAFEAGFFCSVIFYLTLFYKRGELGFRVSIFFGSALLAAAFSGLISYAVFQINHPTIQGWQWLFLIEGGLTVIVGFASYWWLPANAATAWFLSAEERALARARTLKDSSHEISTRFSLKKAFAPFKEKKFFLWMLIAFNYPVAFATVSNFLPQIVQRLGYSVIKTNLWTVAPNCVGFVILLCTAYSSDYFRERAYHLVFALSLSLIGLIILAAIDPLSQGNIAYMACFFVAGGAYIPSCLGKCTENLSRVDRSANLLAVHSWHNNNDTEENSRAAKTGFLVGLGNLAGVLSAATFRVEYAPSYIPTLIATSCCNITAITGILIMKFIMVRENRRRDKAQGRVVKAEDVDTSALQDGENDPNWRYFT